MNRRSSILLIEIMISILFFSLASALCLRMFVKSRQLDDDTRNLNMAANQAQNVMELMRHFVSSDAAGKTGEDDFFPACILTEYPDAETDGDTLFIYYNQDWERCTKETCFYFMEIKPLPSEKSNLLCYYMEAAYTDKNRDSIYSFEFRLHTPNRP